jgi:isoleucyl-tRNA synthetase
MREGRTFGISVDGHEHELGPDDLTLVLKPLEGYQVEREGSHAVALDLGIDDELRREGLAREVVRAVQYARKDAGLEVADRIALALGGDAELVAAVRAHEEYVAGETLALELSYDGGAAAIADVIDGLQLRIGVTKL